MTEDPARYPPSWYAATRTAGPAAEPLAGDARADVCVIGGGYTGLGAALRLAERGIEVAVLESGPIGWGASGRNGGQVHVGMRREQGWLEEALGREDARQLWRIAIDARDHLDRLIADHAIDCDLRDGLLHLDHKRRYLPDTRANVALLNERYDYPHIRLVEAEEASALVAARGYHGGSYDARGGQLHALNLALGMGAAAVRAGARLHAHSRALALRRERGGWAVETARGTVRAGQLVLACNGYLRGLEPRVENRVMPINNFIAVTEPLGRDRAEALIRGGIAVSDSRFVVYYFRMTHDDRLLFGGGESYGYRFPRDIAGAVRAHIGRVFPQLREVRIDHAWGGTLAITPKRMPYVREVEPGLVNASGYSGLGVVLGPYVGRLIGEAIAGGHADFNRLTRLPVPPFPGGRWLRWPTLAAAMSIFALRDRL